MPDKLVDEDIPLPGNNDTMDDDKKKNKKGRKGKTTSDPDRFSGVGVNFKAKLIGIESVVEARGDKMCQDAMARVKSSVKTTGEHKQKIIVNISLSGIKIMEEKSQSIPGTSICVKSVLYHHAVHKISFISRDVGDSRAFGYVYGLGDGKHDFFGIKTDKPAEALVLSLRDLFQVVFEMKKREKDAQQKTKGGDEAVSNSSIPSDSTSHQSTEQDVDSGPTIEQAAEAEEAPPAIANLLDLDTELSDLNAGIAQMGAGGSSWATPWSEAPSASASPQQFPVSSFPVSFDSPTSPLPAEPAAFQVPVQSNDLFSTQSAPIQQNDLFATQSIAIPSRQNDLFSMQAPGAYYPQAASPAAANMDTFEVDPFFAASGLPGASDVLQPALSVSPGISPGPVNNDPFASLDSLGGNRPLTDKREFFQTQKPSLNQLVGSSENIAPADPFNTAGIILPPGRTLLGPPPSIPFRAAPSVPPLASSPGNPFA